MKFRCLSLLPVAMSLLSLGCSKSSAVASDPSDSSADEIPVSLGLTAELFNVATGEADPRFEGVPASISRVELGPNRTIRAVPDGDVGSVSFSVGGGTILDSQAPFLMSADAPEEAAAWSQSVGEYSVVVRAFASADGSGEALAETTVQLAVTDAGLDTTPDEGEHQPHLFWITKSGKYVTRNEETGDFLGLDGAVVLASSDVELQEPTAEEGEYITTTAGAEEIEFAFMALLPDGYDPSVKYPMVVFLHHGWNVFRGTDNDGRMLRESPLFAGGRSISSSSVRHDFPAVILVPQLIPVADVDGVTHEWAAFTTGSVDNNTGDFEAAESPSRSAAHTFRVIDEILDGTLPIGGGQVGVDKGRVYLTGHSMGGLGTWDMLARRPDFFAAGVPMAGYPDHESASALSAQPIWAFHHEIDCYNPHVGSQTMLDLIVGEPNNGTKMKLTTLTFDTAGKCDQAHFQTPNGAWNDEPGLFDWIFSQARSR